MWQLIKCHRVWKTRTNPSVKTLLMPLAALLILLFSLTIAAPKLPLTTAPGSTHCAPMVTKRFTTSITKARANAFAR